jgi:hypothetical protein
MSFVNAFIGAKQMPTGPRLAKALGDSKTVWDDLIADLEGRVGIDAREWKSYSSKAGWTLRLLRGKRAIVYLSPGTACFLASFALGDKAILAARRAGFPEAIVAMIDAAKKYPEGTAVRVEVRTQADAAIVLRLAAIKRDN